MRVLQSAILVYILCLPIMVIAQGSSSAAPVQTNYSQDAVKAQLIERFTRFIRWPESPRDTDHEKPFVIGLLGDTPLAPYLDALGQNIQIRGKRLQVLSLHNLDEIDRCQLLFISGSEKYRLNKILERTRKLPIVTIGDTEGFAKKGVLINFFRHGSNIRFEINHAAVRASGLQFSSRLLRIAKIIDESAN